MDVITPFLEEPRKAVANAFIVIDEKDSGFLIVCIHNQALKIANIRKNGNLFPVADAFKGDTFWGR